MAAIGSLATGIYDLFGGHNANNVQLPQMWQQPNMTPAANNAFGGIGDLGNYNLYAPNIGTAQGITSGLVNNPYASAFQAGAGTASGMGQQGATNQFGAGANLYGAGDQMLNNVFNNQSGLYNYLQNQNMQQANAENAAAGVGTTPYGAGVADMANQQFNLNWQNFLQGQQLAALQGAGNAYGGAAQLQSAAPQQYLQASAAPYSTYGTIGGGQIGALGTLGQFGQSASALPQQQVQDYLAYIGQGNQANSVANQTGQLGLNQNQLGWNQTQTGFNALGNGFGALSNMNWSNFSNPFAPSSGGILGWK